MPASPSLVDAVMVSCAQRESARALTIPQLEKAGVAVTVLLDDCTPPVQTPPGNGPIGLKAIRHAIAMGWEHVLIVEDDIDLAPDFPMFLTAALDVGAVTYFYLNDSPTRLPRTVGTLAAASILRGEPQKRRLTPAWSMDFLLGTQCVLLPARVLPGIARTLEGMSISFDRGVLAALSERPLIALPHPVQHRHDRTGRPPSKIEKRSYSADLQRVGEEVSLEGDHHRGG